MKYIFQGNSPLYLPTIIILIILLLVYPFYLKLHFPQGPNDFKVFEEFFSITLSALTLIIAFRTIEEQRKSFIKQTERLDFTVKVEALSKAIEIRKLLMQHNPDMKSDKNEIKSLASLYKKLDKESLIMIEKIDKESVND